MSGDTFLDTMLTELPKDAFNVPEQCANCKKTCGALELLALHGNKKLSEETWVCKECLAVFNKAKEKDQVNLRMAMLLAFEAGFRVAEKGTHNLQAALAMFENQLK